MKINILGTDYELIYSDYRNDPKLDGADGYCDPYTKRIVVCDRLKNDIYNTDDFEKYQGKVLRHEIIHAFLYESGLDYNAWAGEEEIVDWIAIQSPKLIEIFRDVGAITCET